MRGKGGGKVGGKGKGGKGRGGRGGRVRLQVEDN